jgi:hypothetical protein
VSELEKIVLTACLTLIGGVLLLVAGQVITRFVVDPLLDFRRLLGDVAYALILNAKWLCNPNATADRPEFQEAKDECRKLASRLHAFSAAVPLYNFLTDLGVVPPLSDVYAARGHLIGLSNMDGKIPIDVVKKHRDEIARLLRIRVDD